ncbi:MAG: HNH endonuclease [Clostridia bacterium]|nr:HNH endonuclease [Clostridia bacterium]
MKEYKLKFELVPDGCWYTNLRSALPPAVWDKVRRDAYARASGKCTVCGRKTARLEAHERWSYDEKNAVQKLETVIALCKNCHEVTHISRTQLVGRGGEAMEWFMKVNACTQMDFHEALGAANEEHKRRNKIDNWTTDISWLKDRLENI